MTNILRGISHTLAAVTSNCAAFDEAWRSSKEDLLWGRWTGEWRSEVNEHHGELRCVLKMAAPNHLHAFVHARYAKVMRVCYSVDLRFDKMTEPLHLEGEADLGELAGGIYRYDGVLSDNEFKCRYECKYDRGEFRLRHDGQR